MCADYIIGIVVLILGWFITQFFLIPIFQPQEDASQTTLVTPTQYEASDRDDRDTDKKDIDGSNKDAENPSSSSITSLPQETPDTSADLYANVPPILMKPTEPEKIDLDKINFTDSGSICGNSAQWEYGEGVLHIYGTGRMFNYYITSEPPWYEKRNQITAVVISDGITYIGDEAFKDCVMLEHIEISSSVERLGSYSFMNCRSLISFVVPETVKTIGGLAFNACIYLEEIFFSEGTCEIGTRAFQGCKSLTKIIFPESMGEIGNSSFYGCTDLVEVYFLSKVTSIGNLSFEGVSPDLTIHCYENSTADAYAKLKKIERKFY